MRKHSGAVSATIMLVCVLVLVTTAMAGDPFIGTWKLNTAKSTFNPGPAPKSEVVKIEAIDNGLKHTFDSVDAQGKSGHSEWSPKFDGKDYPMTGDPTVDTGTIKRIDANTIEAAFKKAGKEVSKFQVTVSKDGKTVTASGKGKDEKGQEFSNTEIYDKQ